MDLGLKRNVRRQFEYGSIRPEKQLGEERPQCKDLGCKDKKRSEQRYHLAGAAEQCLQLPSHNQGLQCGSPEQEKSAPPQSPRLDHTHVWSILWRSLGSILWRILHLVRAFGCCTKQPI